MTQTTPQVTPLVPRIVGVLGGGRMGAGIAHAFLISGAEVIVVERDDTAAAAARDRVERDLAASLKREVITGDFESWARHLRVTIEQSAFTECELVIEAVPEDLDLKLASLTAVETHLGPDAWLASNTSSLSIDTIAARLARPERFCGLHFFNPVPASRLVEVVSGEHTSEQLRERALSWVAGIGKTPIAVADAPGFASSRLGVAIALEAIRMVEEGVASAADIDAAMVLGYKHPVGPLALTDIVGLDVRLGIATYLESTLGERFAPPQLLRELVERGDLGRKSGRGFYDYSATESN